MSEEMKEPMQTDNDCKTEEAAASTTETMADYEDHFDDANPWNLVTKYMEEYLKKHYDLEDHRQDEQYQSWNDSLVNYNKTIEDRK